ncbi:MafI family immunity protein [Microlunatus soli]|uniref:MafI family immunity protein n=1 Tax=Microlunatus soli TaxID=630515 RepID=A0A1H1XDE7_9ACTN|nr:MafI family immunity protein [Microlunatus soli]SDT07101.1 hypothetical protein SAMN04489812_4029 [Microlunatus soli]
MLFSELERRIGALAGQFRGQLPLRDQQKVEDELRYGEYGLALDLLCTQLYEWDIHVGRDAVVEMRILADAMQIDVSVIRVWEREHSSGH